MNIKLFHIFCADIPMVTVRIRKNVHVLRKRTSEIGDLITKSGKCYLCHNKSKIPEKALRNIMRMIEAKSTDIINKWIRQFGKIKHYC